MAKDKSAITDVTTIQMALVGYQIEKQRIEDKIRELQARLKGKHVPVPSVAGKPAVEGPKRILSPAARRRIAQAQKKRWAEHRRRAKAAKQAAKTE